MKKLKSFKRMSAKATSMLLCLATSATCMTLAVPYLTVPHAAEGEETTISGEQVTVATGVNIVDSCDYGKTFKVPAGAVVTAPNGEDVTPATDAEVKANQIGNYKVSFVENELDYDFYVRVRLDEEYFLKVDYNGADIPSYVAANGTFTLPSARVCYYDDNNILQEYPGEYTVTARNSFGNDSYTFGENANNQFTAPATTGKVFITYDAVVGEDGTKHFSQTFTVNVQSTVQSSTSSPTLSVSGVQRDVSVNRAVTLPKATATDSYDDNVKVEITVTDPQGEPVKNVDIDENGYAREKENATAVLFDNDKAMTFYPTKTGSYKVTYTAYNDNGGKSSTREYYITVSDLVAPVFKNVEEWRIPETWGMNVVAGDGDKDDTVVAEGGKITFSVPDVVDNKDHAPANADDKDDVISMYFRITDSDNSKTIVEFTNILADDASDDCKFKYNSTYEKKDDSADSVTFNRNTPFTFDFSKYNKTNSKNENQEKPGTYTVLYRARDKANNTSSRTFTVTLQDTFTDSAAPTTAEVTVPDYISAADTAFTVPQASVADASDTRLKKVYRIYNNGEGDAAKYIDVEGGEVADIENVSGVRTLIINKGKSNEKTLPLTDKLYFYVSATDKVGNFKSNTTDNSNDYKKSEAQVTIISSTQASDINFNGAGMANVTGTKKASETVSFGGFTIETAEEMRNYTGFEVAAYDPKGNALNITLETMSTVANSKAKIYVQNISFNLPVATEDGEFYRVMVRVFDVNGNNNVYGYKLGNIEKSDNSNVGTQAISTIGTSGEVATTYKLHNEVIKGITGNENDVYRVVRKISGGIFALMGSEFTAKTQGSYTVYDGYILENETNVTENNFVYDAAKPAGGNNGVYNFSVTDTAAPVIEIQGVLPTYKAFPKNDSGVEVKNVNIDLPNIVAYTENGEAKVEIEVKGPKNGNEVKLEEYEDGDNKGVKYFTATADGAYTVTVTATYANATPASAKYTVNVGDVQGPEFKLVNDDKTTVLGGTYTVGTTFKFAKMELLEDESGVEITKTLVDPSNENVSDASIRGSYSNNKDRLDNGTDITFGMAGKYKVVYTAKDTYGNETKQEYEITVVSSGSSTPTTWTTLSTVLIVVAVVLLAGVIVYVVRFRKVKK